MDSMYNYVKQSLNLNAEENNAWKHSAQDTLRLVIPRSHFVSVDKRFTIAASSAWNTLSLPIGQITNIDTFKNHLKTFLFTQ